MPGGQGYRQLLGMPMPRRLALASLPADLADWLDYAAVIALLVYVNGEGPFVLAALAVALGLPYVVVGPVLALWVDRTPLRRVLVLANLGRAVVTLGLVFAGNSLIVLLLVFLRGCVDSAFTPARQSAIQATTPPELLSSANGLHQSINQTSKIAGPALGGLLLGLAPVQAIFAVNAGLSLLAVLIVLRVQLPERPRHEGVAEETLWTRLTAGIGEYRRSRLLLLALIFSSCAYFAFFLYDTLIVLLGKGFGLNASDFGLSIAASGLGGLFGALLAGRIAASRPLTAMAGAALLNGAGSLIIAIAAMSGLMLPAWAFFGAMALLGGASGFMMVPYRTVLQQTAPPDRIARVFSAGEAVTTVVMLVAPFIGSAIATAWGPPAAFLAGAIVLIALGAGTFIVAPRFTSR